jgi:4-amino-4-deoxy-L-arabinose transferase-like glycosyltransferase
MIKNEKIDLAILLLASLILSIYLFFQTYVISMDGAFQYIPMAKVFASGLFKNAIGFSGQQPLYSFLIALISRLVSDFELAGKLISSFFGILIIFPVYFLGKRIFDEKIALLSSLFLVIHPYIRRFSADVLKESTYLFFLGIAIWFAWRTIQSEKRYPYLFIPLFSALAYLVRPDGFEVLLVVFFYVIFVKKFSISGRKRMVILLLLLSSCILFLPYLIHLRETTGVWTLSRAKTMAWFLGLGMTEGEASFIDKFLFSLKRLNFEIFFIYHPLYIFFANLTFLV